MGSASPQGPETGHRLRRLAVLIGAIFLGWTAWATGILPRLPPSSGLANELRSVAVRVLLWVVPSAIYLRARYGAKWLRPLRVGLPPTREHWLAAIAIVCAASFAVSLDVARKLDSPVADVWLAMFSRLSWGFPVTPVFEELIFRGVILSELTAILGVASWTEARKLAGHARFWGANLAASLVFTGLHWPWWIYTGGFSGDFWMKTAGVFLLSLVLGIVFVRGCSLWPCIALHWLNNELSSLAP